MYDLPFELPLELPEERPERPARDEDEVYQEYVDARLERRENG